MQVNADLIIRKVGECAFEARLVNPADHSETYARGSWGASESEAIRNLRNRHKVTMPAGFKID